MVKSLRLLFLSILYVSIIFGANDRCFLSDIHSDISPIFTSRSYYDIGDTLNIEDLQRPYNVCHSDNNYFKIATIFVSIKIIKSERFSLLIIVVTMTNSIGPL